MICRIDLCQRRGFFSAAGRSEKSRPSLKLCAYSLARWPSPRREKPRSRPFALPWHAQTPVRDFEARPPKLAERRMFFVNC